LGFCQKRKRSSRRQTEAIPTSIRRKGRTPLKTSLPALANTAVGWFSLFSNTDGSFNTAVGTAALLFNVGDQSAGEGIANTAVGAATLLFNTTGANNTAVGAAALLHNTTGSFNTANGYQALLGNTIGTENTASGYQSLLSNTTGDSNTATGSLALLSNTEGGGNTANGEAALYNNTTGNNNTANGLDSLFRNTEGGSNTANGFYALYDNTTGNYNTADGDHALGHNTTGSNNTALGVLAGNSVTTANNVIAIGHPGANLSDSCYIGNIFGATIDPSGVLVGIDSTGKLGTTASSRRFKEQIQPMDKASEALLAFKPVTFRYKNYKTSPRQFGLIAEEVAEVNPDMVARDENGEIYTVRYEQINAMLLNEFLKEHRKVEEQEKTIAELKSGMTALVATVKEQSAQIQKVSTQIEMSKPAPQTVNNNQ
jgi:hypothetical protein